MVKLTGEHQYLTVGYTITTMLHGANLPFKVWPRAFHHCLFIHKRLLHGDRGVNIAHAGGLHPDLSHIHTFGCQVFAPPPDKCASKLEIHANGCSFLGYTATYLQARYLDLTINKLKTSAHA
jgi:hypothetical protein